MAASLAKKIKTQRDSPKTSGDEICEASYWDWPPIEMQEKIMTMAAREVHRKQWKEVC